MIGMRGRHGKQVLIDGDIMELRNLMKMGETKVVSLPKLWFEFVSRKGELKGVGILDNGESLIIKPYYGDNGAK